MSVDMISRVHNLAQCQKSNTGVDYNHVPADNDDDEDPDDEVDSNDSYEEDSDDNDDTSYDPADDHVNDNDSAGDSNLDDDYDHNDNDNNPNVAEAKGVPEPKIQGVEEAILMPEQPMVEVAPDHPEEIQGVEDLGQPT